MLQSYYRSWNLQRFQNGTVFPAIRAEAGQAAMVVECVGGGIEEQGYDTVQDGSELVVLCLCG